MDELLKYFPKEVGIPYRIICQDRKAFFKTIDTHNGNRTKIYFSVYNVENGTDIMLNCLAFDFDSEKCLENIEKFHTYCENNKDADISKNPPSKNAKPKQQNIYQAWE